jgi:predicted transport protein
VQKLLVYVKVPIEYATLEPGFAHDVANISHLGTGDFELIMDSPIDHDRSKPYIQTSFVADST